MLDGRHTGTGGGNHIVFGGATPKDSPLLRRPDLLKSPCSATGTITPASATSSAGLFIGPTSQAPRVDEAATTPLRAGARLQGAEPLHRRETATSPPWLVDRSSAICWRCLRQHAPHRVLHRQALRSRQRHRTPRPVELRSFEMPPHAEMSLAQHLLLRAAIARFWDQPYEQKLVRWGTELHDRFMLPHFVWDDFTDVMGDMKELSGYDVQAEWFARTSSSSSPPSARSTSAASIWKCAPLWSPGMCWGRKAERRAAPCAYVDSSLERVQVKTSGPSAAATSSPATAGEVPLHPPAPSANTSPACATAPGSRRPVSAAHHRRPCAAGV
jgi:uncharacterized protein (DUF2126 family)